MLFLLNYMKWEPIACIKGK